MPSNNNANFNKNESGIHQVKPVYISKLSRNGTIFSLDAIHVNVKKKKTCQVRREKVYLLKMRPMGFCRFFLGQVNLLSQTC